MIVNTEESQRFGVGDIAMLDGQFRVKVIMPILDNDTWFYEVEAVDFDAPFTREVHQDQLSAI